MNNLIYMNLKDNFVLVKFNQNNVEEIFILKLKRLSFILFLYVIVYFISIRSWAFIRI